VKFDGAVCKISRGGHPFATLSFESHGCVSVGGGHISPAFGIKVVAPRLVWTGEVDERGARTGPPWSGLTASGGPAGAGKSQTRDCRGLRLH
jgi:hypothetical protein